MLDRRKRLYRKLGLISFVLGIFFSLNAISGITGLVISESVGAVASSILGIVLLVLGILLFIMTGVSIPLRGNERKKELYLTDLGEKKKLSDRRKRYQEKS